MSAAAETARGAGEPVEICRSAGGMLELEGRLETAITLFRHSGDWDSVARILLRYAGTLIGQGRNDVLLNWLRGLPVELIAANARLLYWLGVSELYVRAREEGRLTRLLQCLTCEDEIDCATECARADECPRPIAIFTLGRFGVLRNGGPLRFGGREQREPLRLLKVLIAFGGRDVSVGRLAATLCPQAEGDAGQRAVTTSLFRLRKLIGNDAVRRHGGRISLDPECCWVDCWELERLLNTQAQERSFHFARILSLYHRPFLCCEDDSPWSLPMREKLHGKLVQYVKDCGRDLERSGLHDQAIRVYLRGLEVDDLVEEFYRGLIMSSIALGQNGDAALAYRRCQKVLSARLGVEPSPETRSLYLDMQRQVEPRRDDIRSSARS